MNYEVEQKHRVVDRAALVQAIEAAGGRLAAAVRHVDTYFNHPSRDFAQTDEAFRIRRLENANYVTYKGPKIDPTTKTRRELELPIAPGDDGAADFAQLLSALGFTRVAEVRKTRRAFELTSGSSNVAGAVDNVEGLGTFVELELTADDAGLADAKRDVAAVARLLGLGESERRSYLELLLSR